MISTDSQTAKNPRPHLGAKVPHDVYAELLRVKELSGKSETQIINEAIAAYLGIENGATVPDRVSQVEIALAELQQQVGTILGKFQRLAIR
jgi:hypothetical protein